MRIFLVLQFCLLFIFIQEISAETSCGLVRNAADIVEMIRGSKFKTEVNCKMAEKRDVKVYLENAVKKIPAEKLINEELAYKMLGLLPAAYAYKDGIIAIYTNQIAGYYDPEKNYYAMAGWLPEYAQMPVTVHELTHALQDQLFVLDNIFDQKLTTDESMARSALIEGEASAVMSDFILLSQGKSSLTEGEDHRPFLVQNLLGTVFASFTMSSQPSILIASGMFPYISGLNFAAHFIKTEGYRNLDGKFSALPKYTAEILHPETYGKRSPVAIGSPKISASCNSEALYRDRGGEFSLSTFLGEYIGADSAAKLSAHWSNDSMELFECGDDRLLVWQIALDSESVASELSKTLKTFQTKRQASSCQENASLTPSDKCLIRLKQVKIGRKGPVAYIALLASS